MNKKFTKRALSNSSVATFACPNCSCTCPCSCSCSGEYGTSAYHTGRTSSDGYGVQNASSSGQQNQSWS